MGTSNAGDPMESLIRDALSVAKIPFIEGDANEARLDFYLSNADVYIEVKQFHSNRIAEQMSRAQNVIVAQGRLAVTMLAQCIAAGKLTAPMPVHSQVSRDPSLTSLPKS